MAEGAVEASQPARARDWLMLTAVALLAVGVAAGVYEPWVSTGFPIEDFSEFRPVLEQHGTFAERLAALVDYYATQGRWNVVVYAFLAAKWTWLGPDPVLWQLLRFTQMLGVAGLVFYLARSFRLGLLLSAAASLWFLFTSAAAAAFTRLTMSEPLALTIMLLGLLLAQRYQATSSWRASAAALTVLAVLLVASKEILGVCVPLIVGCALCWSPAGWSRPRWTRRNVVLVAMVVGAMVPMGLMILHVMRQSGVASYATSYGESPSGIVMFAVRLAWMTLPVQQPPGQTGIFEHPANLLALVLLLVNGIVWWRWSIPKPAVPLALLATLPALGAAAYSPWPWFEDFYPLPFQLGVALLLACSIDAAVRRSPRGRWPIAGVLALGLLCMAVHARFYAERAKANARLHLAVADVLASLPPGDSAMVVSRGGVRWSELAQTLGRTVEHRTGRPGAVLPGVRCDAQPALATLPSTMLVVRYVNSCGPLEHSDRAVEDGYGYFDWETWSHRVVDLRVEIARGTR